MSWFQLLIVDIGNVTERGLAESLDYTTERQLQRIENGETDCSVDKLMEIAQILNTSTDYLLFGIKIENNTMVEALQGKTEGQKRFIQKIMKAVIDNMELLVSIN